MKKKKGGGIASHVKILPVALTEKNLADLAKFRDAMESCTDRRAIIDALAVCALLTDHIDKQITITLKSGPIILIKDDAKTAPTSTNATKTAP